MKKFIVIILSLALVFSACSKKSDEDENAKNTQESKEKISEKSNEEIKSTEESTTKSECTSKSDKELKEPKDPINIYNIKKPRAFELEEEIPGRIYEPKYLSIDGNFKVYPFELDFYAEGEDSHYDLRLYFDLLYKSNEEIASHLTVLSGEGLPESIASLDYYLLERNGEIFKFKDKKAYDDYIDEFKNVGKKDVPMLYLGGEDIDTIYYFKDGYMLSASLKDGVAVANHNINLNDEIVSMEFFWDSECLKSYNYSESKDGEILNFSLNRKGDKPEEVSMEYALYKPIFLSEEEGTYEYNLQLQKLEKLYYPIESNSTTLLIKYEVVSHDESFIDVLMSVENDDFYPEGMEPLNFHFHEENGRIYSYDIFNLLTQDDIEGFFIIDDKNLVGTDRAEEFFLAFDDDRFYASAYYGINDESVFIRGFKEETNEIQEEFYWVENFGLDTYIQNITEYEDLTYESGDVYRIILSRNYDE